MNTPCRVEMMGGLRLHSHVGTTDRFRTRKTAELLAYLACFHKRRHPREMLIDLLWPENDVDAGRHSLSMALSCTETAVEINGGWRRLDLCWQIDTPWALTPTRYRRTFRTLRMPQPRRFARPTPEKKLSKALSAAVGLYSGEVLSGFYADWACLEQQRLEEQFLHLLHPLVAEL